MDASMDAVKKVTIHVPAKLLAQAQKRTGAGVTETIRRGLRLVAAEDAFDGLRKLRGKVDFTIDVDELRADRR
jgi:hypothetical protein